MTDAQSRLLRRRAAYLKLQAEEAERARARAQLEIARSEALFERERRARSSPTLMTSLGDKLRAAGFNPAAWKGSP